MSTCPPIKSLVDAVESDQLSVALDDHLSLCEACSAMMASLREESEGLTISVGDLWVRERISCPHKDILQAYNDQTLPALEMDYIKFHLETVDCPYCQAEVESAQDSSSKGRKRLEMALDESMRRSAALIGDIKKP